MRDRSILEPTFEQYKIARDFKKYPVKVGGVCGVATNNADYVTKVFESLPNGKRKLVWVCPAFSAWCDMMKRGFSQKRKERFPAYKNVTVCKEWYIFSNFRIWWVENNVRGWQLDKDIINKGNLVYGPDSCIYIPRHINILLTDSAAARGDYPIGVCRESRLRPYRSECSVGGKKKYLGHFPTPQDAHRAWQIAKIDAIKDAIAHYTEESKNLGVFDERIVTALEDRISILQDDVDNNRETLVLH